MVNDEAFESSYSIFSAFMQLLGLEFFMNRKASLLRVLEIVAVRYKLSRLFHRVQDKGISILQAFTPTIKRN